MTKLREVLLGSIVICMFAVLPLAHATDMDADGPQKVHTGQRIYSQLNLTDDQKKQLEANKQDHRAVMEKAHQEIKASREALQEELMKAQLDMPKINGLHAQINVLLTQMEDTRLSSILAVRNILTPEQFTKFVNLMHKHRQEHNE